MYIQRSEDNVGSWSLLSSLFETTFQLVSSVQQTSLPANSGVFSSPPPISLQERRGYRCTQLLAGPGGLTSIPHAYTAKSLPAEPLLQPSARLIKTSSLKRTLSGN